MAKHEVVTTDAELEDALRHARGHDGDPVALSVEHIPELNVLVVGLSNRRRLVLPVEELQGLERATHEQLTKCELVGRGTGISFPALDADFYVPALMEGVYGTRRWMAELGKKGGGSKTDAKRQAARENGAKGGRPKKAAALRA